MAAQKIKLISKDGKVFMAFQEVAFKSKMIKDMCETMGFEEDFDVNVPVDGLALKKVMDYCMVFRDLEYKPMCGRDVKSVQLTKEQERFLRMSDELLVQVIEAADFLDIPDLLDILSQKLANMIEDKKPHEIRAIFQLSDDLPMEKKKEVQKKWDWLHM